jgi:hypothetical protein
VIALRTVAILILFAAAPLRPAAAPLPSPSATRPTPAPTPPPGRRVTYAYKTFRSPVVGDYFKIDQFSVEFGTMTLTFNPDKSIRGTYAPDFGNPASVTGTVGDAGLLSLQVGGGHFDGRFTRRGFAAATASTAPGTGERLWGQFLRALGSSSSSGRQTAKMIAETRKR